MTKIIISTIFNILVNCSIWMIGKDLVLFSQNTNCLLQIFSYLKLKIQNVQIKKKKGIL